MNTITTTTPHTGIAKWLGAGMLSLGLLAGSLGLGAHPAAAAADLRVDIADSANTVGVGEELTYTITVRNQGSTGTAEARLTVTAFDGATILSVSQPGVNRFQSGCQVLDANSARCTNGFFDRTEAGQVAVRVRAPQTPGQIDLRARVSRGTDEDENLAGNIANESTQVIIRPDLRVTDIDGPAAVGDNASGSYLVTVRNSGGSTATDVVLVVRSQTLPWDFFQVEVLDDGASFNCALTQTLSFQTPTVTCTGGSLSANESARVRIRARTGNVLGSGNGRIKAISDAGNFITESNEDNNVRNHAVSFNGGIL